MQNHQLVQEGKGNQLSELYVSRTGPLHPFWNHRSKLFWKKKKNRNFYYFQKEKNVLFDCNFLSTMEKKEKNAKNEFFSGKNAI